jgi:hypothetical protein
MQQGHAVAHGQGTAASCRYGHKGTTNRLEIQQPASNTPTKLVRKEMIFSLKKGKEDICEVEENPLAVADSWPGLNWNSNRRTMTNLFEKMEHSLFKASSS